MRLAVTADWHVDRTIGGRSRYDEILRFREQFVEECRRRQADIVLHLGDWADPGGDALEMQVRIADSLRVLSEAAGMGVRTIPGNHDVVRGTRTRSTLSPMATLCPIECPYVYERPACEYLSGGVYLVAAPYPCDTRDYADLDGAYHTELRAALGEASDARLVVVMSHLQVGRVARAGDVVDMACGEESGEMARGGDCLMPRYLIEGADLVLQGHYHAHDHFWVVDGDSRCEVRVPGSPIRHTFGERSEAKGMLFVDV